MKIHPSTCLVLALIACVAAPACRSKGAAEKPAERAGEEHEEAGHDEGAVKLTAEQRANAGLQTAKVERRSAAAFLEATAEVQAPEDRQARVGSPVPGRVASVRAKPGDRVGKGSVLIVIDSPDVGRAKADYLSALAAAKVAAETSARERTLFEKKVTSEREWRQAESEAIKTKADRDAAENRLHALGVPDADLARIEAESHYSSTMPVASPLDGVVVAVSATTGQMVEAKDALAVVMDLREVLVLIDVYDRDLPQIRVGQGVRAKTAAYPDREFAGKVESIGAVLEEKTRSVKVRVALPNSDGALKPGMFATVTLEGATGETRDRIVVPSAALQREGEGYVVFVPKDEDAFEPRKVKVARQLGDWAEVESGLSEGETVVTTGSFFLKSELQKAALGGHGH